MARIEPGRVLAAAGGIIALALLAAAMVISHAHKNALLGEEVLVVPVTPQLAFAQAQGQDNIWNDAAMGTDSIFMHRMSSKDVEEARQARARPQPSPYQPAKGMSADDAWRHSSPFTGTNSVFFGSNGGGNGWASKPQSLYGEAAGGWSTRGHEAHSNPNIASVPHLGGTNYAFEGADGYHYGWARKNNNAKPNTKGTKAASGAKHAARNTVYGTQQAAGGWSARGHEAHPNPHMGSVPHLGGTNFAFEGADGYHYGWARQPPVGRVNKDQGVKPAHVAHPKLGFSF